MTTHAIPSRARPPTRGFTELVKVEAKLAWRVPVGLVLGVLVPVIFLVIFNAMPALRKPAADTTLTLFAQYVPVLICLSLCLIALVSLPIPLVTYRQMGVLRRFSTTPAPRSWLLPGTGRTGWASAARNTSWGWSSANAAQARVNYTKYGKGVGVGAYWFMGGPGVDPHYNGTAAEASAWGAAQAARALRDIANGGGINYPVVWADIELPGITPAPDNGWNNVCTSSGSGIVKQHHLPAAIDRAEFNGFASYIASHSPYRVGVYSSPGVWTSIFGTGATSLIPNTYEWTYQPETANLGNAPYGWHLNHGSGAYVQFFGGQTYNSKYALMWQWSGGGGVRNGVGDFDQIDWLAPSGGMCVRTSELAGVPRADCRPAR